MEVLCTSLDTQYACSELAAALRRAAPRVRQVAQEYMDRADDRTLLIVFHCPCCSSDPWMDLPDTVLVTPFYGIDPAGYKIHEVGLYPPFQTPGRNDEAETLEEYLDAFRQTIERALSA